MRSLVGFKKRPYYPPKVIYTHFLMWDLAKIIANVAFGIEFIVGMQF